MPTRTKKRDDIVTIGVHDLVLNEDCPVFDDDKCEKVFVSVEFLDYKAEDLETPYALDKGEPNTKYSFNFQTGLKNFIYVIFIYINFLFKGCPVGDPQKQQKLADLIAPGSSGESVI
jgi:hypothetical protein